MAGAGILGGAGSGMWGVVILFVVAIAIVSLIALCYHSRRQSARRRLLAAASPDGGVVALDGGAFSQLPPGHRLGMVAAESPSGRHIIIVGMPPGGAYGDAGGGGGAGGDGAGSASARARQLLPNGKLPTPPSVIANLPTYQFATPQPPPNDGGGGEGGGDAGAAAGPLSSVDGADPNRSTHRQTCAICCDDFSDGTTVKLLPCMHSFCAECVDAWLARDTHCPICKESVIRAAGMSDAQALELVVAAAGAGEAARRRQIDGADAGGRGGGGGGGGGAGGGGRRGPDLQLQAQQQRLWQLSRQQQALQQLAALQPQQPPRGGAPPGGG
ncbi:MAG: hypothetical protein J3K34DRAFT_221198 [Monoraphidium minutum]|nr:MAG: hypothetical protein J3K34DRAFT_221198 [Monoraphidium minutum]